ncbi:MAG: serine hydrolase [Proteobacteria bacterium]|nr:serine hydrolase [Pseudomonadota bacterium]
MTGAGARGRVALAALVAATFVATNGAAAQDHPTADEIRAFADRYFAAALAEVEMPGAVAAIVWNGEIIYLAGYGAADRATATPMDATTTRMRLGSVSKPLTGVVAVAAAEAGIVRMRDDVRNLLATAEIELDGLAPVTLHHLLTHSSGFGDRLLRQHAETVTEWRQLSEFLATNEPPSLLPPGTGIMYSDLGMALTGAVLEQAAGESFPDLAERLVFRPAGMAATTFDPRLSDAARAALAQGYRWRGSELAPVPYDFVMTTPAAGAVSTAEDIARLMQLILAGGGDVIGPDSVALLISRQAANYRTMRGRAYGFSETTMAGRTAWFHDGSNPGFSAHLSLVPELGLGVFVAANGGATVGLGALSPTARMTREFPREMIAALWPAQEAPPTALVELSPDDRADYAGAYREARLDRDTPLKVQGLIEQIFVFPVSDVRVSFDGHIYRKIALDVFQSKEDPSRFLRFLRDDTGDVSFVLLPNATFERVSTWESVRVQVIVAGLALGFLMLGTIIVAMALSLRWWGRLANWIGLASGVGGLALAVWFGWQAAAFSVDIALVHGMFGLPYPAAVWMTLAAAAAASFLFALFGRGIHGINRWGLVFVAGGWLIYVPFLGTWQLLG